MKRVRLYKVKYEDGGEYYPENDYMTQDEYDKIIAHFGISSYFEKVVARKHRFPQRKVESLTFRFRDGENDMEEVFNVC